MRASGQGTVGHISARPTWSERWRGNWRDRLLRPIRMLAWLLLLLLLLEITKLNRSRVII